VAHRFPDGRKDWATFSLMLPGQLEQGTIEARQAMKDLFVFKLQTGDYERRRPIELFWRGEDGRGGLWKLQVE
jgi:hypothetical protein